MCSSVVTFTVLEGFTCDHGRGRLLLKWSLVPLPLAIRGRRRQSHWRSRPSIVRETRRRQDRFNTGGLVEGGSSTHGFGRRRIARGGQRAGERWTQGTQAKRTAKRPKFKQTQNVVNQNAKQTSSGGLPVSKVRGAHFWSTMVCFCCILIDHFLLFCILVDLQSAWPVWDVVHLKIIGVCRKT